MVLLKEDATQVKRENDLHIFLGVNTLGSRGSSFISRSRQKPPCSTCKLQLYDGILCFLHEGGPTAQFGSPAADY